MPNLTKEDILAQLLPQQKENKMRNLIFSLIPGGADQILAERALKEKQRVTVLSAIYEQMMKEEEAKKKSVSEITGKMISEGYVPKIEENAGTAPTINFPGVSPATPFEETAIAGGTQSPVMQERIAAPSEMDKAKWFPPTKQPGFRDEKWYKLQYDKLNAQKDDRKKYYTYLFGKSSKDYVNKRIDQLLTEIKTRFPYGETSFDPEKDTNMATQWVDLNAQLEAAQEKQRELGGVTATPQFEPVKTQEQQPQTWLQKQLKQPGTVIEKTKIVPKGQGVQSNVYGKSTPSGREIARQQAIKWLQDRKQPTVEENINAVIKKFNW